MGYPGDYKTGLPDGAPHPQGGYQPVPRFVSKLRPHSAVYLGHRVVLPTGGSIWPAFQDDLRATMSACFLYEGEPSLRVARALGSPMAKVNYQYIDRVTGQEARGDPISRVSNRRGGVRVSSTRKDVFHRGPGLSHGFVTTSDSTEGFIQLPRRGKFGL